MTKKDEPMERPGPQRIGRGKKFDALERAITGGQHIGHLPVYIQEIEGWIFRRCRCGFTLALTPSGAIWWLRTTNGALAINSFEVLLRALNSNCWAHPRPLPLKIAAITPSAIADIATETPPASESAIATVPPPASLEMQNQSTAQSNGMAAPLLPVQKPPPAKRRRTYIPDDTKATVRGRRNPPGR
jgi:hypothetical protein